MLTNDTIKEIAQKYNRSTAQIIINWINQKQVFPVVKASQYIHQIDNFNYLDFELSEDDIQTIDALDKGEDGRVEGQNPYEYEEFV